MNPSEGVDFLVVCPAFKSSVASIQPDTIVKLVAQFERGIEGAALWRG